MNPKTRKILRAGAWLLFGVYLLLLCYLLFFSETMGRTYQEREYHYNLSIFKEIRRFLTYRQALGMRAVCINLLGNIVAFIPFGLFVPLLSRKQRHCWRVVLLSFDFSLIVEILQLVSKVGSFDVDDLILNTIGGLIGYLCFVLFNYMWQRKQNAAGKRSRDTGTSGE